MSKIIDAASLICQRLWSQNTFGPGYRPGVIAHIEKELREIEADPTDVYEWVDVIILALDGAMRAGHRPQTIIDAYHSKMLENLLREWPDWRLFSADQPIEHVR